VLTQHFLEDHVGVQPTYFSCPPDLTAMMFEAKAAVLIGDAALRATYDAPRHGLTVHDLGSVWRDLTGLPMVFAVWAVRREFANAHPGLVKEVHDAFVRSRDLSLLQVDEVAASAAKWEDFDAMTLAAYFRTLDFSLGERQLAGLEAFVTAVANRIGIRPDVEPEFTAV
jgi:chorismate dehydratase